MTVVFELVQHNEFVDPYYLVIIHDEVVGRISYDGDGWAFQTLNRWRLNRDYLYEIADKLVDLDNSLFEQRILKFL